MANHSQNQKPSSSVSSSEGGDPESTSTSAAPVFMTLTREALLELLREARVDPRREAELEAEGLRVAARRTQMVQIARADEASRQARQAACQHRKPNGEETMGGQEFSDGRVRIFCLRCQKVLRSYWSPTVAQGMAIQSRMTELGLTEQDIRDHMDFQGIGNPTADLHDDFALGTPRGAFSPDLTTENQ